MKKSLIFVFVMILLAGGAYAQFTSATGVGNSYSDYSRLSSGYGGQSSSFLNYQGGYSAERLYGSDVSTYWPQLNDPIESCRAREDLILQVSPAGCEPAVVRSDLLAEQNVPVFCQVDALKLNPLIDIQQIRNIRFVGDYPPEVVGVGFHPAQAALRSQDRLLGSPLINNIGYVVVVMKQNEIEDSLPDFVNFTLHAQVEYDSGNSFGVGRASFLLSESSDSEWAVDQLQQTFWQGRYSVRLESVESEYADVSLYQGDRKISTVRAERGRQSEPIYVPGFYCQSGVQVAYDGFVDADDTATILADGDVLEVTQGTRFLNDKCSVHRVVNNGVGGSVEVSCGSERFNLEISNRDLQVGDEVTLVNSTTGDTLRDEDGLLTGTWRIDSINEDSYTVSPVGEGVVLASRSVAFNEVRVVNRGVLPNPNLGTGESAFNSAVEDYRSVVDSYPRTPLSQNISGEEVAVAGEVALFNAIEIAGSTGKQAEQAALIETYLDNYGANSTRSADYRRQLDSLYNEDQSRASVLVNLDNKVASIKLIEINEVRDPSFATFRWGGRESFNLNERSSTDDGDGPGIVTLVDVRSPDEVLVSVTCPQENQQNVRDEMIIGGPSLQACGSVLQLEDIESNELARIRLIPNTRGTATETNFTVGVGIEKRAIQLSPEKAREKIDNLDENIDRWSGLSNNLESAVEGLKAACFATSAVLTAKNFLTGLSGEGFARKNVMDNYWTQYCNDAKHNGEYSSVNECFLDNNAEIESDVSALTDIYNSDNEKIKAIQVDHTTDSNVLGGIFGEGTVDGAGARVDLVNEELSGYSDFSVSDFNLRDEDGNDVSSLGDLVNEESAVEGDVSLTSSRNILSNIQIAQSSEVSQGVGDAARENIKRDLERVIENKKVRAEVSRDIQNSAEGEPKVTEIIGAQDLDSASRIDRYWDIKDKSSWSGGSDFGSEVSHVAKIRLTSSSELGLSSGIYLIGLAQEEKGYSIKEVRTESGPVNVNVADLERVYRIGNIDHVSTVSYSNNYKEPKLRYYETDPYKGYPAIVPFDTERGWYTAVEQNLPFGGRGNYDQSGRPAVFWVCNVGDDGREQFFTDRGKDICARFDINSGQAFDRFPGLSEDAARTIISRAQNALREASLVDEEDRRGSVRIQDAVVEIGSPAAGKPGTQCQDFMSARECQILFNVCDPVICPSSRCDFGGQYPVADVIQTGIVGSALLCLPNAQEGVFVPVCLTGIQAGIDGYVSILESYQQCLEENIDTGRTVGICDQINSVYMCEFFWRQAAPLADVLVPKAFEIATGQGGSRGGGEYLNVQNAWDNTQGSIDFFTQNYAQNSLEAFRIRSSQEAGSQVCRAFISAKGPDAFDTLIEADSPVQYHSWFSETPYTSATVPATSQYKVFYHIYSGNDQGSNFRIYLRSPTQSSFFSVSPTVQVSAGFIPRGQFLTDTADFTAPEGYQELCVVVNGDEQCGFKQVSTSFAVNQLRDGLVSNELTNTGITSENGCVSGGPSPVALLNPSIQGIADEAVSGGLVERGITRVCATQNPGLATEPGRFVDVGFCGDESVRCWLDQKSVDAALTDNNVGVRNSTLKEIEDIQFDNLAMQGEVLSEGVMYEVIAELEERINSLSSVSESELMLLIDEIDLAMNKAFYNHHKAKLLILRGDAYAAYARQNVEVIQVSEAGDDEPVSEGIGNDDSSDVESSGSVDTGNQEVEIDSRYSRLGSAILFENTEILTIDGNDLLGTRADGGPSIRIGSIENERISINPNAFSLSANNLYSGTSESLSFVDGAQVLSDGLATCSVSFYREFLDGSIQEIENQESVTFAPGEWYFAFENCPSNVEAVLEFTNNNFAVEHPRRELSAEDLSSGRFDINFVSNPENSGDFIQAIGIFRVQMIHPITDDVVSESSFGMTSDPNSEEAYFTDL